MKLQSIAGYVIDMEKIIYTTPINIDDDTYRVYFGKDHYITFLDSGSNDSVPTYSQQSFFVLWSTP